MTELPPLGKPPGTGTAAPTAPQLRTTAAGSPISGSHNWNNPQWRAIQSNLTQQLANVSQSFSNFQVQFNAPHAAAAGTPCTCRRAQASVHAHHHDTGALTCACIQPPVN